MRSRGLSVIAGGLLCVMWMQPVWANSTLTVQELMAKKLGRGIMNVVSSPLELIRVPALVSRHEGVLAGGSVGLMQGAWHMLLRAGAGICEIITFPSHFPPEGKPLIEPEFVWANGNWVE